MKTPLTETGELSHDADCILRSYARRFARPYNLDPMELYQESVLYMLERVDDYDPAQGALSTWLWFITAAARHRLIRRERLMRGYRQPCEPLSFDVPGASPDPADEAERADLARRVRRALATLPAADRRLIVRRYGLDGRAPATLRKLLRDRTGEACRQRLIRLLRRLRVNLQTPACDD